MTKHSLIPEEMRTLFKENYVDGDKESLEQILISFRKMKCSNFAIAVLLKEELGLSISEANDIILDSKSLNTDIDGL